MRAGGCSVQQALTSEATNMVKQAVTLAKQRGHAQVTPLHVANTMLSSTSGLFRKACLQSHTHPLQCRALELCFNVALNRLPASSSSSPILGSPHSQFPSISNALVAAFKRAQAHQRRGSVETQQQPLLAVKIELEQLIISILDDPSVSRVMREAGFSSTKVKSNVENAISLQLSVQNPVSNEPTKETKKPNTTQSEYVNVMIDSFMNMRRKSLVLVGECIKIIESVVRDLMDRVEKRNVPEELREVKFISIPLFTFANQDREEVEEKIKELSYLVRGLLAKGGVVLYLGDLKWVIDYRANQERRSYYCPIEHMIMELGRLVFTFGESGNFRVMGIATFQTYTKCRNGNNSLQSVLGLHPLTMPAESLGLSLFPDSNNEGNKTENGSSQLLLLETGEEKELNCCAHCSAKYEAEVRSLELTRSNSESTLSTLPSWLKDVRKTFNNNDQRRVSIKELCEKWNSICIAAHKQNKSLERALTFPSSSSPSSSNSCFSYDPPYLVSKESFLPNPNPIPISTSSSDTLDTEYIPRYKEFNSENLNNLCHALEIKVPWRKEILPEIVGTLLQCRSGMVKRKSIITSGEVKQETWFFFLGQDAQAKEQIARELAKVFFGSYSNFISIGSSFSCTRTDSSEDLRNKRSRDEQSCSYIERFSQAVSINPHRVFFMEDVDQTDYCSQKGIKRAIERGKVINSGGEEVSLSDSIIILSCENLNSRSRACSPSVKQRLEKEEGCQLVSLDLNISLDHDTITNHLIDDLGLLEIIDRCIILM